MDKTSVKTTVIRTPVVPNAPKDSSKPTVNSDNKCVTSLF